MLGDLIYEGKNRTITGSRVLNAEENKIEHSCIEEGRFKKDIQITILGNFGTIPVDKDIIYAEGQHIITTKEGGETATFRGSGIGGLNVQTKGNSFRGSVFYKTSSNGKLAFLNNMVGVFEIEEDESGNGVVTIWEWK